LFMSRHEVHSMNTHTLQNAGRWKQTKQNVVQGWRHCSRRNHREGCRHLLLQLRWWRQNH